MALWNDISPHEWVYGARHFVPVKSVSITSVSSSLSSELLSVSASFPSVLELSGSQDWFTAISSLVSSAIALYTHRHTHTHEYICSDTHNNLTPGTSTGFWLGGVGQCTLAAWKYDNEMVHSEVYLNKYVVSIVPFSTPACPDCSQNITYKHRKLHVFAFWFFDFSLFNFSSSSPGGSADPIYAHGTVYLKEATNSWRCKVN